MTSPAPSIQSTLRYFDFTDEQRLRFAQTVNDRPLSDRARKFLRLAFDATSEHGRPGLRVRYYDRALIVSCPQERLAELLDGCCVKTVQRMIEELEGCKVLEKRRTVPRTDGPPVQKTVYVVFLDRLEELRCLDPTDELDCVILDSDGDLRGSGRTETHLENAVFSDVVSNVARDVVSDVVCPVVSVVASDVVSLMKHEHAKTHENKTHEACSMQHEVLKSSVSQSQGVAVSEKLRFSTIPPEHVDSIVRRKDRDLFLKYFADAVHAKFAKDSDRDRLEMAALFHQVNRVAEADSPGAVIHRSWKNRARKPLALAQVDEDFARKLLAGPPQSAAGSSVVRTVSPLKSLDDELADDLAKQHERRLGNLQALRAMTSR